MSTFGYCKVPLMPMRSNPSDPSEMVSQLLFGEFFEKISDTEKSNWIKIKSLHDNYEGFVDPKQVNFITETYYDEIKKQKPQLTSNLISIVHLNNKLIKALQGSDLRCTIDQETPLLINNFDFANSYLGTPYLWGGRSPFGIDCSGLTQVIFAHKGIEIPRDASQQVKLGTKIQFGDHLPWDLVFFQNNNKNIIHVGIIIKNNNVLHAHGEVKISQLTEKGLLNDDNSETTHIYHSIKRI